MVDIRPVGEHSATQMAAPVRWFTPYITTVLVSAMAESSSGR